MTALGEKLPQIGQREGWEKNDRGEIGGRQDGRTHGKRQIRSKYTYRCKRQDGGVKERTCILDFLFQN